MSVLTKGNELFDACRVLFGPDIHLSHEFLDYLQASGARSAYRRRAKEVHPDLVTGEDETLRNQHAQLFRQLAEAFDLVTGFLESRDTVPGGPRPTPAREPTRPQHPRPQQTSQAREYSDAYYRGVVPPRPMEIGLYLYYRGVVTFRDLMSALLWQRKQRPSVGSIARRWGWLSAEEVQDVMRHVRGGRFGERAVVMDLLTPFQVQTLLYFQRCRQQRLGDYFVAHKLLSAARMERLVAELAEHNRHSREYTPGWSTRRAV